MKPCREEGRGAQPVCTTWLDVSDLSGSVIVMAIAIALGGVLCNCQTPASRRAAVVEGAAGVRPGYWAAEAWFAGPSGCRLQRPSGPSPRR